MGLKIKKQLYYYKHYGVDLWGELKTNLCIRNINMEEKIVIGRNFKKGNKKLLKKKLWKCLWCKSSFIENLVSFFFQQYLRRVGMRFEALNPYVYEFEEPSLIFDLKWKKPRIRKNLSSLILTRAFYITLNFRQFRRLSKIAKRKEGFYGENYLLLLEGRICCFIYRSSIISNMFEAIKFVKLGNVNINKIYIRFPNYLVPIMKFIGFRVLYKGRLFWDFMRRLMRRAFYFTPPKYLFFSYIFFVILYLRAPKFEEITNPCYIDMYRAVNYVGYSK
jgi:hypothetical protein